MLCEQFSKGASQYLFANVRMKAHQHSCICAPAVLRRFEDEVRVFVAVRTACVIFVCDDESVSAPKKHLLLRCVEILRMVCECSGPGGDSVPLFTSKLRVCNHRLLLSCKLLFSC